MFATAQAPDHLDLRERVIEFLANHTVLNLATEGPAGLWASQVLYVHDGVALYFTSVATTRHGINMSATGHIAGTVSDECLAWTAMKGIQLEGRVERVDDVAERRRVARAYLARYPFACGLWDGTNDVDAIAHDPGIHQFYRVTPTRLLFTDNEHAPAGREELAM